MLEADEVEKKLCKDDFPPVEPQNSSTLKSCLIFCCGKSSWGSRHLHALKKKVNNIQNGALS